jgi:hypothetical protein
MDLQLEQAGILLEILLSRPIYLSPLHPIQVVDEVLPTLAFEIPVLHLETERRYLPVK